MKRTPAFSMGKAKRDKEAKTSTEIPGPGQYPPSDQKQIKAHSPSWTMGGSKRDQANKTLSVPGPGAYEIKKKVFNNIEYQ